MSLFAAFRPGHNVQGFVSQSDIVRHQARAFRDLRARILPLSPFYAPYADQKLADWPIMDRAQLMANFTEINTRNIPLEKALSLAHDAEAQGGDPAQLGDLFLGLSPGTSGQRGLWLHDRAERKRHASAILRRFLPPAQPWRGRRRIAVFYAAGAAHRLSFKGRLLSSQSYDWPGDPEQILSALNQQSPDLILAPARVLTQLAQWQLTGKLAIKPRAVVSNSEVLSPEDEREIHAAFAIWADQIYDSAEGLLGHTCSHGSLHLNERDFHIEREIVDVASGAFRPVITAFRQECLPILRYRMEDVLIPNPAPCLCGCASQHLWRIEGRAEDMIWWQGKDGHRVFVSRRLLAQAIADVPVPVLDYRILQRGTTRIEIALDSPAFARAARLMRQNLLALAEQLDCLPPEMVIRERLEPEANGPRRRIRNLPETAAPVSTTASLRQASPSILRIA